MADGLFLMQRYWGSEDEHSDTSIDNLAPTAIKQENEHSEPENLEHKPKRRKLPKPENTGKQAQYEIELLNQEVIDIKQEGNDHVQKSPKASTSKKKKKKSKKLEDESINKTLENETEFNLVSDHLNLLEETKNSEGNFQVIGQIKRQSKEKIKTILPKWLSNPTIIGIDLHGQEIPISELAYLDDTSKKNLKKAGISFLFPVQQSVIPWLMQSNLNSLSIRPSDLCVSAPTGSGKTLAFVLPIVQSLKDRVVCAVRAVVVLPVSELAVQVYKVFEMFVRGTDLKVILLTGQKSFGSEQNALVKTGIRRTLSLVDIIVTTPGRILDHINRTDGFCLQQLRYLVIDEADRMMDTIQQGWLKQIEDAVYSSCHSSNCMCFALGGRRVPFIPSTACSLRHVDQPLQKLLYSATLSHDPEKLHALSLYKPKLFTAQAESNEWIGKCPIPADLSAAVVICKNDTKPIILCHLVKERHFKKVLCFTKSVERAQRLHLILAEMGTIETREICSNNTPVQRKIVLEQFNSGKVNLLICSDLVARGIDIVDIDCVISYDAPLFLKTYIHRIGRTARAGKKGIGVTLLTEGEILSFNKMLESADIAKPERIIMDDADLEGYIDCFKRALIAADSKLKKLKREKMQFNRKSKKRQKRTIKDKSQIQVSKNVNIT